MRKGEEEENESWEQQKVAEWKDGGLNEKQDKEAEEEEEAEQRKEQKEKGEWEAEEETSIQRLSC